MPPPTRIDIFSEWSQRLAILENEIKNLREDVMEARKDVRELSDFIQQLRGGRIVIVALAGLLGFLGGSIHKIIALFHNP